MMSLRCGTFNLFQFAAPPFYWYGARPENSYMPETWQQKCAWVSGQINRMRCDFIGFQEVFSPAALQSLCTQQGLEHFATVDHPACRANHAQVFEAPVVALASRHPFLRVETIAVPSLLLEQFPLAPDYRFNRKPVRARLQHPELGEILVYVCHLKSKRPDIEPPEFTANMRWDDKIRSSLQATSLGHIRALLQRGVEAAAIYLDATTILQTEPELPIFILGDLNDDLQSIPLLALTNREKMKRLRGEDIPEAARHHVYDYQFFDAWDLSPNQGGQGRPPTHLHRGHGNVLDYVLVSNACNVRNLRAKLQIVAYKVYGEHLTADMISNQLQSDHAQVVVELRPLPHSGT